MRKHYCQVNTSVNMPLIANGFFGRAGHIDRAPKGYLTKAVFMKTNSIPT